MLALRKHLKNVEDHVCFFGLLYIVVDDVVNLEQLLGLINRVLTFLVNWEFLFEQPAVNVRIMLELNHCFLVISNRVYRIVVVQVIVFL